MTPISNYSGERRSLPERRRAAAVRGQLPRWGRTHQAMVVNYTNSAGTTGRTTTSGIVSTAPATSGILLNLGNAASKVGPSSNLAAGDTRVKDIRSARGGTAHASSSVFIGLCKPLCMPIPVPATGLYNMVDFVHPAEPAALAEQGEHSVSRLCHRRSRQRARSTPTSTLGGTDGQNLLDLIGDFSQWKGDVYRLVALVGRSRRE